MRVKEGKNKTDGLRVTTSRDLRKIKSLSANSHNTSKAIFDHAGVTEILKMTQKRIMKQMADINCQTQLACVTKYLKTDFHKTRVMLDNPYGWTKGWLLKGPSPRLRYKHQ